MQSLTKKIIKNIQQGTFWKKAPKALKNRIIKEITASNLIYFFDKGRVLTKNYQKGIKPINSKHVKSGNYFTRRFRNENKDEKISRKISET